jgi:hypothetical protein
MLWEASKTNKILVSGFVGMGTAGRGCTWAWPNAETTKKTRKRSARVTLTTISLFVKNRVFRE